MQIFVDTKTFLSCIQTQFRGIEEEQNTTRWHADMWHIMTSMNLYTAQPALQGDKKEIYNL